jgi:hypothetical protein
MTVDPPRNIISRDEARAVGLKRYFTGKPCKYGHVAERWVANHECVECYRARRDANLERAREIDRLRYEKNKDKILGQQAAKRAADPQKHRDYMRRWRAANKDKINEQRAARRKAARAPD